MLADHVGRIQPLLTSCLNRRMLLLIFEFSGSLDESLPFLHLDYGLYIGLIIELNEVINLVIPITTSLRALEFFLLIHAEPLDFLTFR
jgi:hypothetical protein